MTVRLVQFCQPHHEVADAELAAAFPDCRFINAADSQACIRELQDARILIITSTFYDAAIRDALKRPGCPLEWIQFTTTGIDSAVRVGLPDGVAVTNVRGVRSGIMGAHAVALMLAVMRGFRLFQPHRVQHRWARADLQGRLAAPDGGTAVICGMGGVGRDIARKARAFDMRVIGISRRGRAGGDFDAVVPRGEIRSVLPEADVLFLAQGYAPEVHHFIGAAELALMKPGAVLVNIGRGELTDEAALTAALRANRIAGAGLDVFTAEPLPPDSPFWTLDNVVISPHVAGRGGSAQQARLRALFADNLTRHLAGKPLRNRVTATGDAILDDEAPGNG